MRARVWGPGSEESKVQPIRPNFQDDDSSSYSLEARRREGSLWTCKLLVGASRDMLMHERPVN
eukprot:1152460-Pelagomonas_calceolata.AAC.4